MCSTTQLSTLNPQLTSEFTYDGLGRRVRIVEKTNGVVQSDNRFLWVGTELSEERDSTGATVTKRFFGQGEQISGTNYYFTLDHLGSVREMTDYTGAIRARYEYAPYGRKIKLQGDLETDLGFTGHFSHLSSGLYLTAFRIYDPESGRWLSRDPIEETGGINLYSYCQADPINYVDPLGLFDAIAAHEFWMNTAESGISKGGILGYAQGAGASVMTSFIDFFNAREIQQLSQTAGEKSTQPCHRGAAILAGLGAAVLIAMAVIPGGKAAKAKILFGQASVKSTFAHGPHAGRTIGQIAQGLKAGTISPNTLPIEYVVRNGQAVTLNNRSLLALRRAGIEPTVTRNLTGNKAAEALLNSHLQGGVPSNLIRVRGGPAGTSLIE